MELKKEMNASTQEMTDLVAYSSKVNLPQLYTIGSSDFKILSPYPLKETKIAIPENLITVLEKMEVFVFDSNPYFDGMVSYNKYVSSTELSLEGAVNGAISNAKQLPGVSNVEEIRREYFKNEKYTWCVYELVVHQGSKTKTIKGASIISGLQNWGIFAIVLDPDKSSMVDNILRSIEINK
ncbi:MAG: hypothetical protein JXQ26_07095 [Tissierellales bacterium]|nr:hypothetical protein [Tissierellales bacterium]